MTTLIFANGFIFAGMLMLWRMLETITVSICPSQRVLSRLNTDKQSIHGYVLVMARGPRPSCPPL